MVQTIVKILFWMMASSLISILCAQDYYYAAIPGDTVVLTLNDFVVGNLQWQERDGDFDVWKDIPGATINHYNYIAKNTNTASKFYRAKISISGNPCHSYSSVIRQRIVQKVSEITDGDFYEGGLVFYKKDSMGLVVAPYNNVEPLYGDQGFAFWGCAGFDIPGADSSAVGYGKMNTIDILKGCHDPGTAAYLCDTLTLNGFNDWFLPSLDELKIIFEKHINDKISFFNVTNIASSLGNHWSSTEQNRDYGWSVVGFTFSGQPVLGAIDKNREFRVRAIRKFIRLGVSKFECTAKLLNPSLLVDVMIKKIDSMPANVIVKFIGDGNDTDIYRWNFGKGSKIISGSGRGPYEINYNYGGYNKISVENISDNCDSTIYYSEYFRVKLFEDIMPGFPDIYPGSFSWGDFNNDGLTDILMTGSNYGRIYKNMGADSFKIIALDLPKLSYSSCDWGDFNNDNLLDFAICGFVESDSSSITKVYQNIGKDSFIELNYSFPGVKNGFVKWFDINNDGAVELLISGEDNNKKGLTKIYENFINSNIIDFQNSILNLKNSNGKFGDFNKDGYNDLLITGNDGIDRHSIIYRNEFGIFKDTQIPITGVEFGSVDWGDFNNDGDLDFAISGAKDSVIIYRDDDRLSVSYSLAVFSRIFKNTGNNSFTSSLLMDEYLQFAFSSIEWGDYDNDGDLDLIVTGVPKLNYDKLSGGNGKFLIQTFPSLPTLLRNDSNDVFRNTYVHIPDYPEYIPYLDTFFHFPADGFQASYISFKDYNKDGKLDILRNGYGDMSTIYKNVTSTINEPPIVPVNLFAFPTCKNVKLNWNKTTDDHTPPQSIIYEVYVGTSPGKSDIMSKANVYNIRNTEFTLNNLKPGTYYWSVKAIDQAQSASLYAPEQSFAISPKPARPVISLNGNVLHSDTKDGNQWYDQSGAIIGATNQNYVPTLNGDYYSLVSLNGCSSDSSNVIHVVINSAKELDLNSSIKTYPNPVFNELMIEADALTLEIGFEIDNTFGQKVYTGKFKAKTKIPTAGFIDGLYFICFKVGNQCIFRKMVKEAN